ncbi:MAG: LptF/LptG family permease [Bacteroidales bacterium]|jgi:lipopolysaccharide export system permease protein|nr:LptF/LptG family permease [Bacteroidales bacterium]
MKKIHKLVVKAFLGPLVVTFFISMLVLLMQFLWKYVDDLVGKGLELSIILKFLYYAALTLVPMALPITVLLASLMTLGNMGERYELVAIKASGISLQKLMRPLFVFVLGIAFIAFLFSNNVFPHAFLKYRTLLHDIQMKKPALNIKEGEYYKRIDGYVIRFDKKERDGQTIHGVRIYDHTDNVGNTRLTMAKSGLMQTTDDGKWLQFTLFDGYSYAEEVKDHQHRHTRPFSRVKFDEQTIKFDLSSFEMGATDGSLFSNHEKIQNLTKLQETIDTLTKQYIIRSQEIVKGLLSRYHFYRTFYEDSNDVVKKLNISSLSVDSLAPNYISTAANQAKSMVTDAKYYAVDLQNREAFINDYEIEWHRKFTYPFACILLFLIGAPLGAIIRRGGLGMPVVMAVLIFIAYFATSIIGEKSVLTTGLLAWRGTWISSFIFLPIGVFLLLKATSDAAFLDADVWRRKFLKLIGRK